MPSPPVQKAEAQWSDCSESRGSSPRTPCHCCAPSVSHSIPSYIAARFLGSRLNGGYAIETLPGTPCLPDYMAQGVPTSQAHTRGRPSCEPPFPVSGHWWPPDPVCRRVTSLLLMRVLCRYAGQIVIAQVS